MENVEPTANRMIQSMQALTVAVHELADHLEVIEQAEEERLRARAIQMALLILDLQKGHTPIPGTLTEQWNRGVDCATATLLEHDCATVPVERKQRNIETREATGPV